MSNETTVEADGNSQVALRIRRLSALASLAAMVGLNLFAVLVLLSSLALALDPQSIDPYLEGQLLPNGISGVFTPLTRATALVLALSPLAILSFGLWRARQLFRSYWQGEILSARAAQRIGDIGWVVFALAPVSVVTDALGIVVLTAAGPEGSRYVGLGFDEMDLMAVVFGLLLVIVGRILREAARLWEENRLFV